MGELLIEEKNIAVPGEAIARGMDFLPSAGTYRDKEEIVANRLGIVSVRDRVIKVIAFKGAYLPSRNDVVIGEITDIGYSGWNVDIGAPRPANLPVGEAVRERVDLMKSDLGRYFMEGDLVMAKVINATQTGIVKLSTRDYGLRKLRGGRILRVSSQKVPRVIGKSGSMIGMIKQHTKCELNVGQNGYIWIDGPVESQILAEKAIMLIEKKAHISGLTDKVKEFLESGGKK